MEPIRLELNHIFLGVSPDDNLSDHLRAELVLFHVFQTLLQKVWPPKKVTAIKKQTPSAEPVNQTVDIITSRAFVSFKCYARKFHYFKQHAL